MSGCLPEAVVVQILLKLPITTIVRCTRVCKSWYNLITSSFFISLHLKKSALEKDKAYTLVRHCKSTILKEYYSLHFDDGTFDEYKKFECEFPCSGDFFRIVGICNGLICLSDDQRTNCQNIILWNPMINKAACLPRDNDLVYSVCSLGFGFDHITNDYKVVRIAYQRETYRFGSSPEVPPKVELYRHSSGVWQNISHRALPLGICSSKPHPITRQNSPAYMNGAVHWIAYGYNHEKKPGHLYHAIMLFDMHLEVFGEISLPDSLAKSAIPNGMSVSEYRQMLSVFHHEYYWDFARVSVWIMKEYGVAESWTKQLDIDLEGIPMRLQRIIGFRKTGELLLEDKDRYLISYDPERSEFKNLQIRKSNWYRHWYSFYADSFTESLVFLDKGAEYSCGLAGTKQKKVKSEAQRNFQKRRSAGSYVRKQKKTRG